MTFNEAFGATLMFATACAFAAWYLHCWFDMLFRCQSIWSYFSDAYSSSGLFVIANVAGAVLLVAWLLHLATT